MAAIGSLSSLNAKITPTPSPPSGSAGSSTAFPTPATPALREGLGGCFTYGTLGEPMEMEGMLTGKSPCRLTNPSLPIYCIPPLEFLSLANALEPGKTVMVSFTAVVGIDYYLLYNPDLEYLQSNEVILNLERAERIREASCQNGVKAIVYAPGKYMGQREPHRDGHYILPTPPRPARKIKLLAHVKKSYNSISAASQSIGQKMSLLSPPLAGARKTVMAINEPSEFSRSPLRGA